MVEMSQRVVLALLSKVVSRNSPRGSDPSAPKYRPSDWLVPKVPLLAVRLTRLHENTHFLAEISNLSLLVVMCG
jgi:hypothetical protein